MMETSDPARGHVGNRRAAREQWHRSFLQREDAPEEGLGSSMRKQYGHKQAGEHTLRGAAEHEIAQS